MVIRAVILSALLVASASAQTVLQSTNNLFDLNPSRDAATVNQGGGIYITHTVNDGTTNLSFVGATNIPLYVELTQGGWTTSVQAATSTNDPGIVRWQLASGLPAGQYRLRGRVFYPLDSFDIYDRYLTVTASVAAAATVNINSGAVQVAALTVDLISINSASISNAGDLWIGGTLTAGGLNVTGAVAVIDTGAVRKVGGELTGGLTNRSAGGFVGNGVGLTNVQSAISTVTSGSGNVVTNIVTGGGVITQQLGTVSSGAGGTVQLWTNAAGQVGFTNGANQFVALPSFVLPGGNGITWAYISDYSTDTITSNRNIGTVTYFLTNNTLAGLLPNETAGLRMIDYRPVTSGVWFRAAVEWVQRPQRGKVGSAGTIRSGIAWTTYANNTSYLFGAQSSGTAEPVWKHKVYASNFGLQGDIAGNAPYDVLNQTINLSEFPQATYDLIDYDGTGVVRGFTASAGAHAPLLLQLMTNATFGQPIMGVAIGVNSDTAGTGRTTNVPFQVRRMIIQEGALWIDPSSRL